MWVRACACILACWSVRCGPSASGDDAPAFRGVEPDGCLVGSEGLQHGECDGLQFDLHVQPECLGEACGLVVDLHGATMTGQDQEANTHLGELSRGRGYLVLQPWAPGAQWDVPEDALDAPVVALTQRVMEVFDVDTRRVHVTGFSQGGYMTWRMLCHRPELFASFAPLSAAANQLLREIEYGSTACADGGAAGLARRPVFYAHGTEDAVVDYRNALESLEGLHTLWGLSREMSVDSGAHYGVVRYEGDTGGLLEHMHHDFRSDYSEEVFGAWEGHCFPGGDGPIGCGLGESPSWGELVLDFFEAHPKR